MAAQYGPFDVPKHQQIFDSMFGAGMFNQGMGEARAIGTAEAQVKFAEQLYKQRLAEAEAQARARAEASRQRASKKQSQAAAKPSAKATGLGAQFQAALKNSNKTNKEHYDDSMRKLTGRSVLFNDEFVPMAKNRNISTRDAVNSFISDAKRYGKSKK